MLETTRAVRYALGMESIRSEPELYINDVDVELNGSSGSKIDNLLRAGTDSFNDTARKTYHTFDMGEEESLPFNFTGFYLGKDGNGDIIQHQREYLKKLDSSFPYFHSKRTKLAWLAHTRADCLFKVSLRARITQARFTEEKYKLIHRLKKAIRYAVAKPTYIRIIKLDLNSLCVVGFLLHPSQTTLMCLLRLGTLFRS